MIPKWALRNYKPHTNNPKELEEVIKAFQKRMESGRHGRYVDVYSILAWLNIKKT